MKKRLLSMLLVICMVMTVLPMQVLATAYNDTYPQLPESSDGLALGDTYKGKSAPAIAAPTGMEWVQIDSSFERDYDKCAVTVVEHTHSDSCYRKSCDHKDGHLTTCYTESTEYTLCPDKNTHQHTDSINTTDVVTTKYGVIPVWNTGHPAYPVVKAYYDTLSGWDVISALFNAQFCYTTTSNPDKCTHICSEVGGSCYSKICVLSEHTHTDACKSTFYTWELQYTEHTITWLNGDGTVAHTEDNIDYSTAPSYTGSTEIVKEPTVDTVYTHTGWTYSPALENGGIVDDTVCTPVFSASVRQYEIEWDTGAADTSKTEDIDYGTLPVYGDADPVREYYSFVEWTPAVDVVSGDQTYTAVWSADLDLNGNEIADQEETYTVVYTYNAGGEVFADQEFECDWNEFIPAFEGDVPAREGYRFGGWNPAYDANATVKAPASGNTITYTANWIALDQFTVTFIYNNGTAANAETVYEGETVSAPAEPARDYYTFGGWYAEGAENAYDFTAPVADDLKLTAKWNPIKDADSDGIADEEDTFLVTFYDEDGSTVLQSGEIAYGVLPTCASPSKAATAQFTYAVACWTPEVVPVTAAAEYTATYSATVNKYDIVWVNEDGTELYSEAVAYGELPVYGGDAPTKAADAQYTYTFAGWEPEVVNVVGEATYKAAYTSTINKYEIRWVNEDGTVLETDEAVAYGETPVYDGETPVKAADVQYTYTFKGWSPAVTSVTGAQTYTATYNKTLNKYLITWLDEDGTTVLKTEEVNYGSYPTCDTPTKSGENWTYAFAGWSPAVTVVGGEATYTASYAGIYAEDGKTMNYYEGMPVVDENGEDILADAVIETTNMTASPAGGETTVAYRARESGTFVTIDLNDSDDTAIQLIVKYAPDLNLGDYSYSKGIIKIPLGEQWLSIDEVDEDMIPTEAERDAIVDAALAEFKSGLSLSNIGSKISALGGTIREQLKYYNCHVFAANPTGADTVSETIRFTYKVNDDTVLRDVTLYLDDIRESSQIIANSTVTIIYTDTYETALAGLNASVRDMNGNVIEGAEIDTYALQKLIGSDVGTYTDIKISFGGNSQYKASETTVTLVIDKAPSALDLVSPRVITYGSAEYEAYEIAKNTDPENLKTIDLLIGLDLKGVVENGEYQGIAPYVQINFPSITVLGKEIVWAEIFPEDGITLEELKTTLADYNELLGDASVASIIEIIEKVQSELGVSDVLIYVKEQMRPTDIGLYLAASVSADTNFETSYDVDYLMIVPKATEADLEWIYDDENGVLTPELLQHNILGAYGAVNGEEVPTVTEGIKYVLLLATVDANGEPVFDFMHVTADELTSVKANGAYLQMAYYLEVDNEMYYAKPIVRPFVIIPNTAEVNFVSDDLSENYDRVFTFNNQAHEMPVTVDGVAMEPTAADANPNLTVTYIGLQTKTQPYNSTTPPTHAGAYAVTALYTEIDEEGNLTKFGTALGMMVIKPAEASITVDDAIVEYEDKNRLFSDYITVETNSGATSPDTTVISAGIAANGDFSENGWSAVDGNVNVDFPLWLDTILREYAPSMYDEDGMTPAEFTEKVSGKIPELTAYVESLSADIDLSGLTDVVTRTLEEVEAAAAQLPDNVTLSFNDDVTFKSVGAYVVVGIVTDSDHMPVADTGVIVVVPAVEKDYLKFNYEDENNIFTSALLKKIDLEASAYTDDTYTVLDAAATEKIVNLFLSVDSEGKVVTENDWTKLTKGAYIQVSYIPFEVAGEMVFSDLIARPVILVPDAVKVAFVDGNDQENYLRSFTYGDANIGMGEISVTEWNGEPVDVSKGELKIRYIGVEGDASGYNSTAVPANAGLYTVVVTYTEYDANGDVDRIGGIAGGLLINKAKLAFDLLDTNSVCTGEEQFVDVVNPNNADFVYAVIDRESNAASLVLEEDAQKLYDVLKAELVEAGVMADDDVYDVANVKAAIESVLDKIGSVELPESVAPHAVTILNKFYEILCDLPDDGTVTVNGADPIAAGTYEFYAITISANYQTEVSEGVLTIEHDHQAVVTAPTCTEGGYTTYTCICGDEYVADAVEALGHDYKAVVTAPTCTEGGYTTYTCSVCEDSYVADEVEALGHDYGDWFVVTDATTEAEGVERRDCACGAFETRGIVMTPVFAPVSGEYIGEAFVEILCGTADAKIYYTLDGSEPSAESMPYTGAIKITDSAVIKAIAVKEDMADSAAAEAQYVILGELMFEDSTTVILPEKGRALVLVVAAYDETGRQRDCIMVTVAENSDITEMELEWNETILSGWTLGAYALDQSMYSPIYGDAEWTIQ